MIPIAKPDLGPEEIEAVTEVLRSGMIAQGKVVAEFEERFAAYCGVKHAIAFGNGTLAEMSIFAGLGLGPGDEAITVSHTFAATANSILYTGATPVFVDIEPDTYLIDAKLIERAITPRTRAIMPVHLFGLVADMDMICAIADRHGLAVVEDACQAHGATFRGKRAGAFGHGGFSFYATKNLTTGEGGMVTTRDARAADLMRTLSLHGMSRDAWTRYTPGGTSHYDVAMPGFDGWATLEQLRAIQDSLVKSLTAVYHGRVKYPSQASA